MKAIRERLSVTQAALAQGIGCSQGNIAHYERRGQTVPPDVTKRLIAFARTLGHDLGYEDIYGPIEVPHPNGRPPLDLARAKNGEAADA